MRHPYLGGFAIATERVLAAGIGPAGAQSSVVGPGESIQRAVNAAHPGDTIVVRGVHREDVVIRKNGIKLRGDDATLKPPARAGSPCSKAVGPEGICILGDVDPEAGEVNEYVKDVNVSGFTIKGFDEAAIEAVGASNATITGNRAVGSGETAIGTFLSVGTKILANVTRGPAETGIGLAEAANTKILGNDISGHDFTGIFVSLGSQQGLITANRVHDNNCAGMIFVAEPPGPPADFEVKGNTVEDNRGECGLGIGLFGARGIEVAGNNVSGNVPDGQNSLSGGGVVAGNGEGIAPRNNTVVANTFGGNKPDIRWDGHRQRLRSQQLQHERAGPLVRLKAFRFVEEGPRRRGPSSSSVPSRPDCAVLPYTHQGAGFRPFLLALFTQVIHGPWRATPKP